MRKELALLKDALTTLHPGIYRYETREQVDSLFSACSAAAGKPMPENRYFILLSKLLTYIHCGHTYVNPWNQPSRISSALFSKSYLPFLFRVTGGKMIVTHNLSGNGGIRPGDEIRSIGGIPTRCIVDSLLTVSRSDGRHGLARQLDNINIEPLDADTAGYALFDIYFPLFFPRNFNCSYYRVAVRPFHRHTNRLFTVKALSKTERAAIYSRRFGPLPVHEKNWALTFINQQTARFAIGDFDVWEWKKDYKKYLDSVFTLLQKKHIQNLVVDIRGNEGGDDEARDEVFSYLSDRPFGCSDPMKKRRRFLTIPDSLLPYLKTWNQSFKQPKDPKDYDRTIDGLYEPKPESTGPCQPVVPKGNRFKGRKFLLTDARNSSASFTLAKLFKNGHTGEVIGEPTGGNQQGINGGQFLFFNLPYSKLEIDIPLVWGAYAGTQPDGGIQPDRVVQTTQSDVYYHQDAQINYILKQINKQSYHKRPIK